MTTAGSEDLRRWFVLTMGRSGSSLLCAILADAGADFGQAAPESWDPRRGEMEDLGIRDAAHQFRRAFDIRRGGTHLLSPKLESAWRHRRGRRLLAEALARVRYVKAADLDLAVQPAFALGFQPVVVLSYRRFAPTLRSVMVGRKRVPPDELAADYLRVYRQGLALMQTFGGCAIDFDELQDTSDHGWCEALSACTGLDAAALERARAARARPPGEADAEPSPYPDTDALYELLQACRGRMLPPARTVTRKLGSD